MSEDDVPPDLFVYTFTWQAQSDACPICQALNGREYVDQDLFQPTLDDGEYGSIWDLDANHTLVHPNCRCVLDVTVTVKLEQWEDYEALTKTLDLF